MKNLIFCSFLLVILGCNSLKENKESGPTGNHLKDGDYTVSTIAGKDVTSEKLTFVISEGGKKISGFSGCNTYFGTVNKQDSGSLFSGIGATKMFCASSMKTEKSFFNEMQNVAVVKNEGNTLNLKNVTGETVIVLKK